MSSINQTAAWLVGCVVEWLTVSFLLVIYKIASPPNKFHISFFAIIFKIDVGTYCAIYMKQIKILVYILKKS